LALAKFPDLVWFHQPFFLGFELEFG